MVYLLLTITLLLPTFLGIGTGLCKLLQLNNLALSLKIIMGMMGISLIWTIVALFSPLNIGIETATLLIGFFLFFKLKVHQEFLYFLKNQDLFFFLSLFITLVFASFYPFILDHFGYYIPTLFWLKEVGLVRGIANLDILLGQMSIWHVLQAGFSHISDIYFRINSIVIIAYLFYIFERKAWIHWLFVPILYLFVQSPSPDLPTIVFSLILLQEALQRPQDLSLLFPISVWIFILKPTMMWLPLFVFLYGIFEGKLKLKDFSLGIIITLVFIGKNIYCFGYPIFPLGFPNLSLPWQVNENLLAISSQYAAEKTFDLQYKYSEIQQFTTGEWIINWLFLKGIKSYIHLSFLLFLGVFAWYTFRKSTKTLVLLFICILVKTLLVILFSAQYRFFLEIFFVIIFIIMMQKINFNSTKVIFGVLSSIVFLFLSFPKLIQNTVPSFNLGHFMTGFTTEQFIEPAHFELKQYRTYEIGNLKFNITKNYPYNFDTPLPAISPSLLEDDVNSGIIPQMKGRTLKEGFYWRKVQPKEKEKLLEILKENQPSH